jgi:hypothetical protein
MELSPEVLSYIQSVKHFLKKNDEAREYFLKNVDEELFYQQLSEISQKNFKTHGEAMLSKEQFDLLRKTVKAITIAKNPIKEDTKEIIEDNIFIDYRGLGKICLN